MARGPWFLYRSFDFTDWPRPRWVSEQRWANQLAKKRVIPLNRAIELRRNARQIVSNAFEDERFEDLMRLIFPEEKDRTLFHVAILSIRDGLSAKEIGKKLGAAKYTKHPTFLIQRAHNRIKKYLKLHSRNGKFFTREEPELDPDDELEEEIREVIRG